MKSKVCKKNRFLFLNSISILVDVCASICLVAFTLFAFNVFVFTAFPSTAFASTAFVSSVLCMPRCVCRVVSAALCLPRCVNRVVLIQSDSAVRRDFTVHFWGLKSVQLSNNGMLDWEKYFSMDRYPDIPT